MARGGARPGAGRPQKALRDHLARGTYRQDRHGPRPVGNVVLMPVPTAEWQAAPADVEALGTRARDWLTATVSLFRFDPVEGQRLLAALRTLTRVEALESAIASEGVADSTGNPHPLLAALAREQRVFLSQWAALNLGRA